MQISDRYSSCKRVLVFNPSFIGDAILTTPLVHALQALLPEAEVDLCIRPESAPLFQHLNAVIYDKRKTHASLRGALRFASELREAKYDLILSPHKSLRSSLTIKYAKPRLGAIGFRQAALAWLYQHTVNRNMALHEVERNLSLLEPITDGYSREDAKALGGTLSTYLDEAYNKSVQNLFDNKAVIGLSPGSVWGTKRWPTEHFTRLANLLHEAGYALAITGGPGDVAETDALLASLSFDAFDFANKVPFGYLPAVIANMKLLVTNDSSPLHIAISQNVPTVAIFGATVPKLGFYPYDSRSIVCENTTLDCRPCGLHGQKTCPRKHFKCMLDLPPEQVLEAVKKILG
ncbi:MAG: glycosyltransferase family 9 protein [Deferribacteraceae bacterium]|jgi:heptosyltransferase-2|nr:glycosyltransferase family 9 protein [Deferribacteraceae bacterium]